MVSEFVHISIKEGTVKWPAKYDYKEVKINTFNVLTEIIKVYVKMYSICNLHDGW